jgi:hypothetical protein
MMKWKFVLLSVLTFTLSNAYALQYAKPILVDHKEWTTGNFKGKVTYHQKENQYSASDLKDKLNHAKTKTNYETWIEAATSISNSVISPAGYMSFIRGEKEFFVLNQSNAEQLVDMTFEMCVGTGGLIPASNCKYETNTYRLAPFSWVDLTGYGLLMYKFDLPGNYTIFSNITVEVDKFPVFFQSQAKQEITVPEAPEPNVTH